jgi:probable H4MPT-linked C1 transfer pathway protein
MWERSYFAFFILHFEFRADMPVIGWDIGGVNTKIARVSEGAVLAAASRPFELQRAPETLVALLQDLAVEIGAPPGARHAVTMTAELSQMFRTKRDGVAFVLDAMEAAFPGSDFLVFTVAGAFVDVAHAMANPLSVAAANWTATATMVANGCRDGLLLDIGTTTTDIIPIVAGQVLARGRTDPDRLASGELVYTGAVRTPVEAITSEVPIPGGPARVSAEAFALAADVHVWRGALRPEMYSVPTPDGRPVTREFVRERLARIVCADREMLDDRAIDAIADSVAAKQVTTVADAIRQVLARHASLRVAIVTGVGDFLAAEAARLAGLEVVHLARELGDAAARCAPAAAVALLRDGRLRPAPQTVDVVVKIGGGLLAFPEHFERTLQAVSRIARDARMLVVAGGGPFADAVREADRRIGLSDDASHTMAILAMDQYAHLLASRLADAVVTETADEIAGALASHRLPVLAPSRWVRTVDPLPHSWDVTSDSIAAWVASAIGASQLVLIKPPGAQGARLTDPYFERVVDPRLEVTIVAADQFDASDLLAASMRLRATVR